MFIAAADRRPTSTRRACSASSAAAPSRCWPSSKTGRASADSVKEDPLPPVMDFVRAMQKSPNGPAIAPFLQTLAAVARRLPSLPQLQGYIDIARDLMARTTGSIHGFHQTIPSPGLPEFFAQAPRLLDLLSLQGLQELGRLRHPQLRQSPGAAAGVLQARLARQPRGAATRAPRHAVPRRRTQARPHPARAVERARDAGALLDRLRRNPPADALLRQAGHARARMSIDDAQRRGQGIDRYRAVLAHMVGHRRWSNAADRRQLESLPAHGRRVLRGLRASTPC